MEPNRWTTMTETTLKGVDIVCGTASDIDSNSASSESSLVGNGAGGTSKSFKTNKTSTASAIEGISTKPTALGSPSEHFGSTNKSLPFPQSRIIFKPPDHSPKPARARRINRNYRPRRGNYIPTTSPKAQKDGFPGQLIPRANIPRISADITDASTLLRLFPDVLQNKSTAETEKWVETCKEYGLKVYNQEDRPGMPDGGGRIRNETESGASKGGPNNKQHPSAMQHMPTAENRQNFNGRGDFQDTGNDGDISYGPSMSSQRSNQH